MLRIIGGQFKSRRLLTPPDEAVTRPYAQRVKESIFNLLRGWFEDARVLDLFAGVGTIGLECISRGAARAIMVERDRTIVGLLEQNIAMLECGDRVEVIHGDALSEITLKRITPPFDLVFFDPPYEMMRDEKQRERVLEQAARCKEIMADQSFLVLRGPDGPEQVDLAIAGLRGPEAHRYGKGMWVMLYDRDPDEYAKSPETS